MVAFHGSSTGDTPSRARLPWRRDRRGQRQAHRSSMCVEPACQSSDRQSFALACLADLLEQLHLRPRSHEPHGRAHHPQVVDPRRHEDPPGVGPNQMSTKLKSGARSDDHTQAHEGYLERTEQGGSGQPVWDTVDQPSTPGATRGAQPTSARAGDLGKVPTAAIGFHGNPVCQSVPARCPVQWKHESPVVTRCLRGSTPCEPPAQVAGWRSITLSIGSRSPWRLLHDAASSSSTTPKTPSPAAAAAP